MKIPLRNIPLLIQKFPRGQKQEPIPLVFIEACEWLMIQFDGGEKLAKLKWNRMIWYHSSDLGVWFTVATGWCNEIMTLVFGVDEQKTYRGRQKKKA